MGKIEKTGHEKGSIALEIILKYFFLCVAGGLS